MSARRLHHEQPRHFAFTRENAAWAKKQIEKYPSGREPSAILSLFWRAQEQHGGWLPEAAIRHVADILHMPYLRALEVASFYTMFHLAPVGRHHIQLCRTTPCWLRGSEAIKAVCKKRIGEAGKPHQGGLWSWEEVECLGACVNAPLVQINDAYYEDLNPDAMGKILDLLEEGKPLKKGPQSARRASEAYPAEENDHAS